MRPYQSLSYIEKPKRSGLRFFIVVLLILLMAVCADVGYRLLMGEPASSLNYLTEEQRPYFQTDRYGTLRKNWESKNGKVKTNAFGMRSPNITRKKPEDITRIAIMGDSVSFGMGLEQEEIYPCLLQKILNQNDIQNYEVLNFAAPGFTSYHAVKQYETMVQSFQPDILVLAYGLYDSDETRIAEHELYSILEQCGLAQGQPEWKEFLNQYSTVGHWFLHKKYKLAREAYRGLIEERKQNDEWVRRVSPGDYFDHHVNLIERHRADGGRVILLNANLVNFDYLPELRQLANTFKIPLLDARAIFDQLGGEEERELGFTLQLQPYGFDTKDVDEGTYFRFRVHAPAHVNVEDKMYIVGDHLMLGDGVPNRVALNDHGEEGDEKAGDRIWSLRLRIEEARPMHFAFTNSGVEGKWTRSQEALRRESKNRHFFYRVDPTHIDGPFEWSSLIYFYGKPPFDDLVQIGHYEYPNAVGNEIIARRLSFLIEDEIQ